MKFVDLPSIEMTVDEIFAANQKANTPIKIRRGAKTAAANDDAARASNLKPTTPNASAFAAPVSAPPVAATSSVKAKNAGGRWQTSDNLRAQPVVSRRKWGALWFPLALATFLAVGLLGGWIYAWAASIGDPSFIITLAAIGFGVGLACLPAIRLGKCRSIVGAGALGGLTCALVYVSMLGWSGLRMRAEAIDNLAPLYAKSKKISPDAARQSLADQLSPTRAIALYVTELHQYGVVLSSSDKSRVAGSTGGGTNLRGWAYWAYFVFQMGLTAMIAGGLLISFAKAPFHEGSGTWYRKFAAYGVHPAHVRPLLELCGAARWREAGKLAKESKVGNQTGATATVYHLPGQGGFVRVSSSQNSGSKTLFEQTLNDEEVRQWKPL